MKTEPAIEINNKETDAPFHNIILAGVVETNAYRLTVYRAAISAGVDEHIARKEYLEPEDLA